MTPTQVHIINHTHWDREWFLTSVYTSRWLPRLIDRLTLLVADNPDYRFLFDGQTLVVEDLLQVAPHYADVLGALIRQGNLTIGPYYCQPDWQLAGGELLLRNLIYGREDMERFGATSDTGWLVDTFGHISQAPQLHRLLAIEHVYVWRGVPLLEPYFWWEGDDGSRLLTINLFGGYRNLYGVTHVPEVASSRLYAEVERLRPFYPTADIPLFDGYDLEDNPEDPMRFYALSGEIGLDLVLQETTPATFARHIVQKQLPLPTISGELNSGKYGATFPGTFSARTYLKIMARDCEHLLFHLCEPLAALAHLQGRPYDASKYGAWGRLLLQNAVHDCLCGVSIDQVHEKMEFSYRETFSAMGADVEDSLATILSPFAPGTYAVSTNPFALDGWRPVGDELLHVQTAGVGVWSVSGRVPLETVDQAVASFTWRNDHYEVTVGADGVVRLGNARFGSLVISAEHGDTYSDERGERLGAIRPRSPLTVRQRSAHHCLLYFSGAWQAEGRQVTATVRLRFDRSPLIRWQIELDSRGADLRVEMVFATAKSGDIHAGMPFDVVPRPAVDDDLLPRALPAHLDGVLLGQRDLHAVSTFPFHDFVAVADEAGTVAILARGLHAYAAARDGTVRLTLRRSVEWLTKADLKNRVGDAGPFFYVPDARCERTVQHEVAVALGDFGPASAALQRLNAAYQNPPLIVEVHGDGTQTSWQLVQENVPLSSLHIQDGRALARFYNATTQPQALSQTYRQTDVWGNVAGEVNELRPKEIVIVQLPRQPSAGRPGARDVTLATPPRWRVGANRGLPDPKIIAKLQRKIDETAAAVAQTEARLATAETTEERLRLQHRIYVLRREQLEFELSHLLNRRKLAAQGELRYEVLYRPDEEIAALGLALNQLRIKRRIFDYVVQAL